MNKFKVYVRTLKNGKYPSCFFRIRIIYPDGTAEYSTDWKVDEFETPCWYRSGMTEKDKVRKRASPQGNIHKRTSC